MRKIEYKNSSIELFLRMIVWSVAAVFTLGLATPFVINDMISYFAKGFTLNG